MSPSPTAWARGQLVSASSEDGDCDERAPIVVCRIGTLAPGESSAIRVRVRATDGPVMRNFAATGSGSTELRALNNVASARVRVTRRPQALICGGPRAHAAC
jgi:hypothetical protein